MSFLLPLLLSLIFAACVAFLFAEGMWGNAVRLVNVITAALLAMNFWEPLARFLEGQWKGASFFWDFVALWGLFVVSALILNQVTMFVSRVKVRFLSVVDQAGGLVFSMLIGWVMVMFVTTTLHTAPLAEKFLFGGFDPEKKMFLGVMAPDRQWLMMMERLSRGPFSNGEEETDRVFDPNHQFMPVYSQRRAAFEEFAAAGGGPRDLLVSESSVDDR